jgi:molecular chaperone HtpG
VDEQKKDEYTPLFNFIRTQLEDKIKEVKPSTRLKDSIVCLSGEDFAMSAYMEKIMKATGQEVPVQKRIMELNVNHPVLEKIKKLFETDTSNPQLKDYCELLFDMALISEGTKIENPTRFSKTIADLMSKAF